MRVRFGRFALDAEARQLSRDGRPLRLSPKAFDLLVLLVDKRPAVLDKKTLRERLWPDTHVVDASLSNLVAEIRALGGGDDPLPVRTVHGVGYAFSGEIEDPSGPDGGRPSDRALCWVVWRDRPLPLGRGENVLGRDASCTVWIDQSGVSRRHACIRVGADEPGRDATIEDLNSTNGTFVRGQRVIGAAPLQDGDKVQLGPEALVFRTLAGIDAPTRRVRRKHER